MRSPDPEFEARLGRHLAEWLGVWPPDGPLTVVGSARRTRPGWDGRVYPVAGVAGPMGAVLSVPPDTVEAVRAAGPDLDAIGRSLPGLTGRPGAEFASAVFRWCHEIVDTEPLGIWLRPDDDRVPPWLSVFNVDVLVHFDEDGRYGGGVGRKCHDAYGQELSVATEEHLRGRGLARRLIAQAARRVADEGAVATYLHADSNTASARVAETAGFPDRGWRVMGLPVAS